MKVYFKLDGVPQPLHRPRFSGRVRMFDDKRNIKNRELVAWAWRMALLECVDSALPKATGYFAVRCMFIFPRPKSHFNKDGELKPNMPIYVAKKPDVDNLLKLVMDALNKVAFADDAKVVSVCGDKRFAMPGEEPSTKVWVVQWNNCTTALDEYRGEFDE